MPNLEIGTPHQPAAQTASGTTEATAAAAVTPDLDGFVCRTATSAYPLRCNGFAVKITTAADEGTTSTLAATLKVIDATASVDLTDTVSLCDHLATVTDPETLAVTAMPYSPGVGAIVRLPLNTKTASAPAGNELQLVYNETGDVGDGARPEFVILDWELEVARDTEI